MLSLCTQYCYGCHFIHITLPENLQTSCLMISMHDFISLPDATSYDNMVEDLKKLFLLGTWVKKYPQEYYCPISRINMYVSSDVQLT